MNSGIWKWLFLASRIIVGGVFIYASLDKILHPVQFAGIVFNYKILPDELVGLAAICLPWVELSAGLILISGRLTFASSSILTVLIVIFAAAISFNLARGLDFQCGCFTVSESSPGGNQLTLLRDFVLLIPAILCLVLSFKQGEKTLKV